MKRTERKKKSLFEQKKKSIQRGTTHTHSQRGKSKENEKRKANGKMMMKSSRHLVSLERLFHDIKASNLSFKTASSVLVSFATCTLLNITALLTYLVCQKYVESRVREEKT